ncbi:hypothetical protein LX32DRAFT_431215 [Colletotrichum zoysiae]|uniref:Uncharacterized protein n=1 Tax=Colletotrichum zoysiae TaxID=1216348 RepID=A0AAD9HF54_9PEZI|nr:hypothetical protein LX32DRAFT_431215 [Colletotrichum zoysiae]
MLSQRFDPTSKIRMHSASSLVRCTKMDLAVSGWRIDTMVADVQLGRCRRRIRDVPVGAAELFCRLLGCSLSHLLAWLRCGPTRWSWVGEFVAGECCAGPNVVVVLRRKRAGWQLFRPATLVCIVGEDATYQGNPTRKLHWSSFSLVAFAAVLRRPRSLLFFLFFLFFFFFPSAPPFFLLLHPSLEITEEKKNRIINPALSCRQSESRDVQGSVFAFPVFGGRPG